MRSLTVIRQKTIIGSLMKARIYITKKEGQKTIVNKTEFDKVGELKNNTSLTFSIPVDKVYLVIGYDKISNYSYLIPAGEDNLTLYIKPKLNPFKGNPMIISDKPI